MTSYPPHRTSLKKNNAGNFSESKLNLKAAEEFFAVAETRAAVPRGKSSG
jgi:hypothetical protein